MKFFQNLKDVFNSGDPEICSWFLVRQNYLPLILCGSYAIFSTVIGPAIMKDKRPFKLRTFMVVFNFSIVAAYVVSLLTIAFYLPKISWYEFCTRGEVKKDQPTYTLIRACWIIYLLKYIEFLDTVFFVLRKKQHLITFLHVIHHTMVPLIGWVMLKTEKSGFQSVPVLLNSFVHVVMYTYYGTAAMGPKFRKYLWWKKYLTQLQMIQFFLIIIFVVVITPLSGCSMVSTSYILDLSFSFLFLYLFYKFYKSNFLPKRKSASTNGMTKHVSLTDTDRIRDDETRVINRHR